MHIYRGKGGGGQPGLKLESEKERVNRIRFLLAIGQSRSEESRGESSSFVTTRPVKKDGGMRVRETSNDRGMGTDNDMRSIRGPTLHPGKSFSSFGLFKLFPLVDIRGESSGRVGR